MSILLSEHALLAAAGLALNALLGGPRVLWLRLGLVNALHRPLRLARTLERKLSRDHRSRGQRGQRGWAVAGMAAFASVVLGLGLQALGPGVALLLLALCLPVRPAWDIASQVRSGLLADDLQKARAAFAGTPVRHHALLDAHGLARSAVELLAMTLAFRIVSPAIWYVAFGLPGLLLSLSAVTLLEAAARDDAYTQSLRRFGGWVHGVPVRLSALMWRLAAVFVPAPRGRGAFRLSSLLSAAPLESLALAPAAWALNLTLGGPFSAYNKLWLGSGTPKAQAADVGRARYLFALCVLLWFLFMGLML